MPVDERISINSNIYSVYSIEAYAYDRKVTIFPQKRFW